MPLDTMALMRRWSRRQFEFDRQLAELTPAELSEIAGLELYGTALSGHCNLRAFYSLEGDFPELGERPDSLPDGRLLEIAFLALERYRTLGADRGGFLPEYVAAQTAHLSCCVRCREAVVRHLRRSGREYLELRRLLWSPLLH